MEDRNLSLSSVAGSLGVSERTVRRWIKSGKLKAYKPGRDYRIPESALREFILENEVSPEGESSSLEPSLFNDVEDDRREREMYAATLMENLTERAKALEGTYGSSVDAIPLLEHTAFNEARDALTLLYEEMTARGTPSKKMQDAKERLDKAASRLGAWYWRQAHPESHEANQTRRALAIKRVNRDQKTERNDNAVRQSDRGREHPEAG